MYKILIDKLKRKYIYKYIFFKSIISKDRTSSIVIGRNVKIKNSHISAINNSKIFIDENVIISNVNIVVNNGVLTIDKHNIIEKGKSPIKPSIIIIDGKFSLGNNNVFKATVWIRFKGNLSIGSHNAINEQSEIRCDEKVEIGDFNMISYECMIYDTNTHVIYDPEKRRNQTIKDFPKMGVEYERPSTKPVIIGNDCWLGKRAVVLKGTIINNNGIVGTCAVLSNQKMETNSIAIGNPALIKTKA